MGILAFGRLNCLHSVAVKEKSEEEERRISSIDLWIMYNCADNLKYSMFFFLLLVQFVIYIFHFIS